MAFRDITNSITTFFNDLAIKNNFTVRFDNDPRNTPTNEVWMSANVDFDNSYQAEIGVPTFRNVGIFNVKIKIPIGQGITDALFIAGIIAITFRNKIVDEIINFQIPQIEKVGRVEDDYQVNVICPFQVDN